MQLKELVRFILQSIAIGLAAAFLIIVLRSHLVAGKPGVATEDAANSAATSHFSTGRATGNKYGFASYADAVEATLPAVVNINTTKILHQRTNPLFEDPLFRRFFGDAPLLPGRRLETSLGSGVIVSTDGYILTSVNVIEGADEITVALHDGRQAAAVIVGTDPDTDLAVLHISLDNLPSIVLGDSDALRVGDVVLAIGNPYGYGQTVTQGILSATGRDQLGISTLGEFIQTDAAINPGNSGGALVNIRGELIGINTAIFSKTGGVPGISFAIPVTLAKDVMKQIIQVGHVVRGWLGLVARGLPAGLATPSGRIEGGVMIAAVLRDGPADRAGIQPGDIVTQIMGQPVTEAYQAIRMISKIEPGTEIEITVLRGDDKRNFRPTVVQRPPLVPALNTP
ncbi:MAG: trypsin-like peptidase domain-containing protein [Gammaproteobacteria bacterium]|nr:trypsin-like peptidase domain-containing protein [Gammaproteobacteria bacterium]